MLSAPQLEKTFNCVLSCAVWSDKNVKSPKLILGEGKKRQNNAVWKWRRSGGGWGGYGQKGGSVQTCRAKIEQHTIRWVSQMPAVTGVDQYLAATCKVRNSLSAWACLYIACRYEHSTPWQGTIFSSEHPWIVYIRCNGFTEGFVPHLICFIFSCLNQLEAVGSTLVTEILVVVVRLNSAADFALFKTLLPILGHWHLIIPFSLPWEMISNEFICTFTIHPWILSFL